MDRIESFLEPGERLLWHGRPDANRLVRRQYGWCFLAGAFFGLSLIWTWDSWRRGTVISVFVGLLIVVAGLAVVFAKGREILEARSTRYLVTSRRAVVLRGRRARVVATFGPRDIGAVEVKPFDDGSGDVLFSRQPRPRGYRGLDSRDGGFYGVAQPEQARRALETLAHGA